MFLNTDLTVSSIALEAAKALQQGSKKLQIVKLALSNLLISRLGQTQQNIAVGNAITKRKDLKGLLAAIVNIAELNF